MQIKGLSHTLVFSLPPATLSIFAQSKIYICDLFVKNLFSYSYGTNHLSSHVLPFKDPWNRDPVAPMKGFFATWQ